MALDPMIGGLIQPVRVDDKHPAPRVGPSDGADFRKFLLDNLNRVNEMQLDAHEAVDDLATGKEEDITKVMTAVEKSDVAFQTLKAVRDKIVESYQEILRMRI